MASVTIQPPTAESQLDLPSRERVEPGSCNIPLGKFPGTSSTTPENVDQIATDIIDQLNSSLAKKEAQSLSELFLENSYWRDHLCFSWDFRTIKGREEISSYVTSGSVSTKLAVDRSSALKAPHTGPIDGYGQVHGIEFFMSVDTEVGRGQGVVRLAQNDNEWKIFTIFTSLVELKGYEEAVGHRRPMGVRHGEHHDRTNWQDQRIADSNFKEKEPAVVIVGMSYIFLPSSGKGTMS